MAKLPEHIREIGQKYGLDSANDLWDCQGVWVVYHKALERVAAEQGIQWDAPQIISTNAESDVSLIAFGRLRDRMEWSIGEASSDNYPKRGKAKRYPWAMAEKRAKDRVILKLIGLAGHVYSEEESDDFKDSAPKARQMPRGEVTPLDAGERSNREIKAEYNNLLNGMGQCSTVEALDEWAKAWADDINALPEDHRDSLRGEYKRRRDSLKAVAA